jgi:hypothetical protein
MSSFERQEDLRSDVGSVSMPEAHVDVIYTASGVLNVCSFSVVVQCCIMDDGCCMSDGQYLCYMSSDKGNLWLDNELVEKKDVLDVLSVLLSGNNYQYGKFVYRMLDIGPLVRSLSYSDKEMVMSMIEGRQSIVKCSDKVYVQNSAFSCVIDVDSLSWSSFTLFEARYVCISNYMLDDIESETVKYSKYHTRKARSCKKSQKLHKCIEELDSKSNLGSKKKHVRKVISKKMRTEHIVNKPRRSTKKIHKSKRTHNIEEHSGSSAQRIFEVLEKILGVYMCNYFDKPLYKGLSAMLLLFRGSVTTEVYSRICKVLNTIKSETFKLSDFVDWLKSLLVNVEIFKANKFALSFTKFVTNVFSSFLCPELVDKIQTLFKDNAILNKIMSLFDPEIHPLESVFNYLFYISSAVQLYIEEGVLDGFLDTRTADDSMFEQMRDLRTDFELFKTGDLEFVKEKKMYKFFAELKSAREKLETMEKSKIKIDKRQYQNWLGELDQMEQEVVVHNKNNALKYQPFCYSLTSGSGISKSHVARVINTSMAIANNIECSDYYTFYLNQNNKYQSGWKNSNTVIVVDDACAMRQEANRDGLNLADWLLRGSNNIPHELLGAFAGEKGTLFNRALIESWMANTFDMFFHETARFSSALHRRFQVKLVAKVRDKYCKRAPDGTISSQIDYDKIPLDIKGEIAMDAWLFTAWVVEIKDGGIAIKSEFGAKSKPEQDDDVRFVIDSFLGRPVKDVDFSTILRYMIMKSQKHFESQDKVMEMSKRSNDPAEYCPHGLPKQYKHLCAKCAMPAEEDCEDECPDSLHERDVSTLPVEEHSKTEERIDVSSVKEQSKTGRVLSMRNLLDFIQSSKLSNVQEWEECNDTVSLLKKILTSSIDALSSWFDKLVLDVFHMVANKLVLMCEDFFKNPYKYIPKCCEATQLGAMMHARRKEFFIPMLKDYVFHAVDYAIPSMFMSAKQIQLEYADYKPFHGNVEAKAREIYARENTKQLSWSFADFAQSSSVAVTNVMWECKDKGPESVFRDHILPIAGSLMVTTVFIPKLVKGFQSCYIEEQVGISIPVGEISAFDKQEYKAWYTDRAEKMITPPKVGKRAKAKDLEHIVEKDILIAKCENETMSALSISHQLVLLPYHFVNRNIGKMVKFQKAPCDGSVSLNMQVEFQLMPELIYKIPGDACILYVAKLMDHMKPRDLTEYFPEFHHEDTKAGRLICFGNETLERVPLKNIEYSSELNNECIVNGEEAKRPFKGHSYEGACKKGMCGGAIVDESSRDSCIIGIHVGGNEQNRIGVSVSVLRQDIVDAKRHFAPSRIDIHSAPNMEMYGQDILVKEVYEKNPFVTEIDRCDGLELIGQVLARNSPKAKTVNTPIYEDVKEEFGVDYDFGSPAFTFNGDKKHGVKMLARLIGEKKPFEHCLLLARAATDLKNQVCRPIFEDFEFWKEEIRLLSFEEIINGIPGKKFVNAMNMSTKYGSHKPGAKKDHFIQREDGTYECPEYTKAEYERRQALMKGGIITFETLIQQLKNEATARRKIDIGKVRNFFMTSTETQMSFREYMQTTCRFWNLTSSTSECAVGINPHSTQWNSLWDAMEKFSTNYTALDFKNFDLGVPYEVLSKAIDILFTPVKIFHKGKEIDNVLKCLKHTLLHCMVNVNGDVVIIPGIVPSGINLTSVLGCIVNSLYHRMAAFDIYPDLPKFSDAMFLRTFGDDSMGSVKSKYSKLNVKNIIKHMAGLGIQATDIHKNVDSKVVYHKKTDMEFLKRSFRYDRHFGCNVAPLAHESMFKSLMCHIPPKTVSIEALTGQCVDNFLLEAAFHGKEYYNMARSKMQRICERRDISHHCTKLERNFEEIVSEWKENNTLSCSLEEDVQLWSFHSWLCNFVY